MDLNRREQAFERQFRKKLAMWNQASHWPGIIVCAVLTWIAFYLHNLPIPPFTLSNDQHPFSAVLLALLLGLILRNLVPSSAQLKPGADVVIKKILPLGIILLGAGLDFYNLLEVGLRVLLGAAFIIAFIILTTQYLSRFVKVKNKLSLLGPTIFIFSAVYAHQRRKQEAFVGQTVNYGKLIPTFVIFFLGLAFLRTTGFLPEITLHLTDRFIFGGGDHTLNLAVLLGAAGKWLITGAMAGVGLITEFRALKAGGIQPFTLGLISTGIIAVLGLLYASL